MIRAAICGTDAAEWDHGPVLCRPGVVLGHEFVGRVVDCRRRTSPRLRVGDRVVSGAGISCGRCSLVPPRSHEPLRRVPHARPAGRRRTRRVRDVAGRDLPPRSRGVRRRRGGDGATARRRAPRAFPGRAGAGRVGRGDRRRRHRLVHRRRRVDAAPSTGASSRSTSTPTGWRRRPRSVRTRRRRRPAATSPSCCSSSPTASDSTS